MASDLQASVDCYLADPSPRTREAAVLAGLPLVHSILGRIRLPNHPLASREDLEGTAIEGLLQALDSYDPDRGTQFSTHAYRRIHGAIVDELRSLDVLSAAKRKRMNEVYRAMAALRQELGREPLDGEVADLVGLDLADYQSLLQEAQLRYTVSLDRPASADDADSMTIGDLVPDEDGEAGFEAVEQASLREQLAREIPALPERQRAILSLYYFEGLTLKEVGQVIGVTDARISQILGQTMLTLRSRLMAEVPAVA